MSWAEKWGGKLWECLFTLDRRYGRLPPADTCTDYLVPSMSQPALAEDPSESSANGLCSCRICQTAMSREQLISPCNCKGSLGRVHLSCLERWLNACNREHCEICRFHFQSKRTRRYTFCQSIRVWLRNSRHWDKLRTDLVTAIMLSMVCLGMMLISSLGMEQFVLGGVRLGLASQWTRRMIGLLQSVVVIAYTVNMYKMASGHLVPWYRWWTRSTVIKVVSLPKEGLSAEEDPQPAVQPAEPNILTAVLA